MTASSFGTALRDWLNGLGKQATVDLPDGQLLHRFLHRRDESAFAVLMQRHGPMVFGICRHLLHNPNDAEDVFQATFLVLACRAASIRRADSLAGFLHGTAYRIARRLRSQKARRLTLDQEASRQHLEAVLPAAEDAELH